MQIILNLSNFLLKIWRPDIVLYNFAGTNRDNELNTYIQVRH
jgi:hypothetical protein